jgi:hypothetical protein
VFGVRLPVYVDFYNSHPVLPLRKPFLFVIGNFPAQKRLHMLQELHRFCRLVQHPARRGQMEEIAVPDINADIKNIENRSVFPVSIFKLRVVKRVSA